MKALLYVHYLILHVLLTVAFGLIYLVALALGIENPTHFETKRRVDGKH